MLLPRRRRGVAGATTSPALRSLYSQWPIHKLRSGRGRRPLPLPSPMLRALLSLAPTTRGCASKTSTRRCPVTRAAPYGVQCAVQVCSTWQSCMRGICLWISRLCCYVWCRAASSSRNFLMARGDVDSARPDAQLLCWRQERAGVHPPNGYSPYRGAHPPWTGQRISCRAGCCM